MIRVLLMIVLLASGAQASACGESSDHEFPYFLGQISGIIDISKITTMRIGYLRWGGSLQELNQAIAEVARLTTTETEKEPVFSSLSKAMDQAVSADQYFLVIDLDKESLNYGQVVEVYDRNQAKLSAAANNRCIGSTVSFFEE